MWSLFVFGVVYALAAAAQPGPYQTYVIAQALNLGWRRTLPAAFAPVLSDGPIALLVLPLLSQVPPPAISGLQAAGGLFLLWLASGAFRAWRRFEPAGPAPPRAGAQSLLRATLVNLLNPNPYIGWSLVMGPLLMKGWGEAPSHGIALLLGFYGTLVACNCAIIVAAGAVGGVSPRLTRALLGLSALALACFAAYMLWAGVRGLAAA